MKKAMLTKRTFVFYLLFIGASLISWQYVMNYNNACNGLKTTNIQFNQTQIDMGQLQQGKPQTVSFKFTNTGEYPLVIQQVEASCGCTQPEWSKQPIKPGQPGEIKVTYDAKYPGRFIKTIKVFCNSAKGMVELVMKGEVALDKK